MSDTSTAVGQPKRGRPVGKKIKWSGVFWQTMTNAAIAHKVGTSVVNVYLRRKRLVTEGKQAAFKGAKYTRFVAKEV